MRAIAIARPGGPEVLEPRELPLPEPGASQVRVRVAAVALNRADLLQRRGRYPAPPGWPADVPGLEYAGIVDAVGEGATLWAPGDRVMGLVGGGAYAEAVVVHEREAVPVPPNLSAQEAAAVPEAFITAHDALFTLLGLGPDEWVLIHAVGSGVGTAALQLAVAAGARAIGTSRSRWKLERAAELGLEHAIDVADSDFVEAVMARTGGEGVETVLDLVGGPVFERSLRVLRTRGRIALVGLVAGARVELDLSILLRSRLRVIGTSLRTRPLEEKVAATRAFARHVLPLLESGRVRPVVDRVLPMHAAPEAHRLLEEDANFGKVVLTWEDG